MPGGNPQGRDLTMDESMVEREALDAFMREVGAALFGEPEPGTEWGGGGILSGIRDLQAERAEAVREAGETRMTIAHRNLVVLDQASYIRELRERVRKLEEALQWTSGSDDFAPGGKARDGWVKLVVPLLNSASPR